MIVGLEEATKKIVLGWLLVSLPWVDNLVRIHNRKKKDPHSRGHALSTVKILEKWKATVQGKIKLMEEYDGEI